MNLHLRVSASFLLAASIATSAVAPAKDLPLDNPDFTSGLAGWTQTGWGNDKSGMVYSTTAGTHLYQTVPSHAISADKLKYTVNSGHKDAIINIQVDRAWRGLAEMADALGHPERATHWRERAAKLRAAFRPCFYNPETGWLGWWRSRDGVLHDYASPWVTGWAVKYGLLSPEEGRPMLEKLWAKIDEVGFDRFDLGTPITLLPIKPGDYHYGPGGDRTVAAHAFKHYLNGGCCVSDTFHFLEASHMAGLGGGGELHLGRHHLRLRGPSDLQLHVHANRAAPRTGFPRTPLRQARCEMILNH